MTESNSSSEFIRPELLFGPNPFIERLPPPIAFMDLPHRLRRCAVPKNWQHIDISVRELLLPKSSEHFVSTRILLDPVASIQNMLRRALLMRNPLDPQERIRMNKLGVLEDREALRSLARLEGAGMLLTGMTGTGKTAMLRRILQLIVPSQVLDFAASEACGWYGLKQCVYLMIDHASNGSRGGLLKRILQELGEKVDEPYFSEHERTTNLDTLLVVVAKLLSRHRVALLVIDEHQQSTFEDSPWRMEFVLFYLTLMNLGISVVLCGNPLAFEHLRGYSQVMRRFSVGGVHRLQPAASLTEKWWKKDFVPEARRFSIVDRWEIPDDVRCKLEFEQSGGLPGLFAPYHVEVQRCCLRRGGTTAVVTEADFAAAAISPHFIQLKLDTAELTSRSRDRAREFLDIPQMDHGSPSLSQQDAVPTARTLSVVKRLLKSFTTAQTKKSNALLQKLKSLESMHPDDIRTLGVTQEHLNHLEAMASASAKRPGKSSNAPEANEGKAT